MRTLERLSQLANAGLDLRPELCVEFESEESVCEKILRTADKLGAVGQHREGRTAGGGRVRRHHIRSTLIFDELLVTDTGHSGIWTGTMVDAKDPNQTFIRCAGSLGWAFPAAMGVKCALPDRPVVCFTGDGGFWYHLGELETAVRYGINTVTIINNNHSLNQEKHGNERYYGGEPGNGGFLAVTWQPWTEMNPV